MARKNDTGWRDSRLHLVHNMYGLKIPVAGMSFAMVEYDRGEPLAIINYIRRDTVLPGGHDVGKAYTALSSLYRADGPSMPFLTAQYDSRNWAFRLIGHNDAARDLIGVDGWLPVTEEHFVRLMYRLRGRHLPANLMHYGVDLSTAPWMSDVVLRPYPVTDWEGQDISVRRRAYEPQPQGHQGSPQRVTFNMRNPCADIDLAVIGQRSGRVRLLVDYKLQDTYVDPNHKTHRAMGGICGASGSPVPSMIIRYDPSGDAWSFSALCLNTAAERMLSDVMVATRATPYHWTPNDWTYLDEPRWLALLQEAASD